MNIPNEELLNPKYVDKLKGLERFEIDFSDPKTFDPIGGQYDPLKFSIDTGSLAVVDDLFSYQVYNSLLTNWRGAAAPANIQAGTVFSDSGDDYLYHYDGANLLRVIQHDASGYVYIDSADGTDSIFLYHDNTDAYLKWSDGNLILQTDEGTNNPTLLHIKPKGTSEISELGLFDTDGQRFQAVTAADRVYLRSLDGSLGINDDAAQDVLMFESAASGETKELKIYGFRASDALRSLEIGVGVDAADTASFDGTRYYFFQHNENSEMLVKSSNTTDGAASVSGFQALGASSGSGGFYLFNPSYTTSNQYIADSALLEAASTLSGGLGISSGGDNNIKFYTNSTFRAAINSGGVGLGTSTIPHGAVGMAKLAIEGTDSSTAGPHVQFTTASDDYPLMQIRPWAHDSTILYFDAYWDGSANKSSDAGSNYGIGKNGDQLRFYAGTGNTVGATMSSWTVAGYIDTSSVLHWNGAVEFDKGSQNYLFTDSAISMAVQGKTAGSIVEFCLFPNDGDGTDSANFIAYGVGTPGAVTNRERLIMGWDAANSLFAIQTEQGGSGTIRPLVLYTEGNTNQLYLGVDGVLTLTQNSDTLTFTGDGTDWYQQWSDGSLVFKTSETNAPSTITIIPNGTSEQSEIYFNDKDASRLRIYTAADRAYISGMSAIIGIQEDASRNVNFFENAADNETPAVTITGFRTGGTQDTMSIAVGSDVDQFTSFTGVLGYYFDAKMGIGTSAIPHGGVGMAKVAIEGTGSNAAGPHMQFTTSGSDYPKIGIYPWTADTIYMTWDSYTNDGTNFRSSDAGSNFSLRKLADKFQVLYDSGIATSNLITWNVGIGLDVAGIVSMPAVYGHDMNGETMRDLQINNSGELGYDSSTRRAKTNIRDMEDTSWLYALRPVNYSPKKNEGLNRWGLIAEEVFDIRPEFTFNNSEGQIEGIQKKEFIFPILNEVQRHEKRIAELEDEVKRLRACLTN